MPRSKVRKNTQISDIEIINSSDMGLSNPNKPNLNQFRQKLFTATRNVEDIRTLVPQEYFQNKQKDLNSAISYNSNFINKDISELFMLLEDTNKYTNLMNYIYQFKLCCEAREINNSKEHKYSEQLSVDDLYNFLK